MNFTLHEVAKWIDHALLNPAMTTEQLESGILMARSSDVASVCILPFYLKRCSELLQESTVKASTTIGFPHGANATAIKIAEAEQALQDGGEELDFVLNIGQVVSGNREFVRSEIKAMIDVTQSQGKKLKVIFENCYLNERQKIELCEICADLRVDWIKTSTGFGSGGATIEDVKLMRKYSPAFVQVKAAGGIRTLEEVLKFHEAGASRIGCSRTEEILKEIKDAG